MVCTVLFLIKISYSCNLDEKKKTAEILLSSDLVASILKRLERTNNPQENSRQQKFENKVHV